MVNWSWILILMLISPIGHAFSISANQAPDNIIQSQALNVLDACKGVCEETGIKLDYTNVDTTSILNMGDWRLYDYPLANSLSNMTAQLALTQTKPLVENMTKSYITAGLFVICSGLLVFLVIMIKRYYTFRPIYSSI